MRKARLHLTPLEEAYIRKYHERDDTTILKLRGEKIDNALAHEIVQLRYDGIYLREQRDDLQKRVQKLEQELQTLQDGCPFPT